MVTFQFAKMSKGQNRLPWVYFTIASLDEIWRAFIASKWLSFDIRATTSRGMRDTDKKS